MSTPEIEAGLRRALAAADYGDPDLPFATPREECDVYALLIEAGYLRQVGKVLLQHRLCHEYELSPAGRAAAIALPAIERPAGRWQGMYNYPGFALAQVSQRHTSTEALLNLYSRETRALWRSFRGRHGQHRLPHVQAEMHDHAVHRALTAIYTLREVRRELAWRSLPLPEMPRDWRLPQRPAAPKPETAGFDAVLARRQKRWKKKARA